MERRPRHNSKGFWKNQMHKGGLGKGNEVGTLTEAIIKANKKGCQGSIVRRWGQKRETIGWWENPQHADR